jgi:hypothetical protein
LCIECGLLELNMRPAPYIHVCYLLKFFLYFLSLSLSFLLSIPL